MKSIKLLIFLLLLFSNSFGQKFKTEKEFEDLFSVKSEIDDPILGIWSVQTSQEFYRYDTLYDVVKFPKPVKIAIVKGDGVFDTYNLNGESYDVRFIKTDVKSVYLYRNYFRETGEYSKTHAVISKTGEMEYTYEFPDDFIRKKFKDSYEEGTRVVNILKWDKIFPNSEN